MSISCGITPHHLMWTMDKMKRKDGLLYKMNPPLRREEDVAEMEVKVVNGEIDVIETDHARHARREKLHHPWLSGYPSLELYRGCVEEFLPGIGVSEETIEEMTQDNPIKILQGKV